MPKRRRKSKIHLKNPPNTQSIKSTRTRASLKRKTRSTKRARNTRTSHIIAKRANRRTRRKIKRRKSIRNRMKNISLRTGICQKPRRLK